MWRRFQNPNNKRKTQSTDQLIPQWPERQIDLDEEKPTSFNIF
jgi:hypothetical protein